MHAFEGRLSLQILPEQSRIEPVLDLFDTLADASLEVGRMPPFSFEFIQDGRDLIPLQRGVQASEHPYWEFILEPGKVWEEPGDRGYTRASIPFSLQQRNANCTHNGLLTFLFKSDGAVSRAAYQITSETCRYLQADLWGVLPAVYGPGTIPDKEAVIEAYREEIAARLPVRPLEALARDYPGVDPGRLMMHDPDQVSTYGFVINKVHYSGGCQTRYGPYPFCSVLDLPSYSLAKSVFAATALMWLEQHYPGAGELLVMDYVAECDDENLWSGVTLAQLVDMSTGNYLSTTDQEDEFYSYETDFIASETHQGKIKASCSLFPRQTEPGSRFVYHSSDTYIAGVLMNAFLREQTHRDGSGLADIYRDVMVPELMKPLNLSPVTWKTKRTYDQARQPFTGFGLTFHSDDIVRFAMFLQNNGGAIGDQQVLSRKVLDAALQRDPSDPGLDTNGESFRYNNGFWAYDARQAASCENESWIPYMSGYGGISIVLIPNNSIYYVFSDGGHFQWAQAVAESIKIKRICKY